MFETTVIANRGVRPRRLLTLEAENAQLRRLLAEQELRRVGAEPSEAVLGFRREVAAAEGASGRIVAAMSDCVLGLDLDGRLISINDRGLSLFGAVNVAHLAGRPWAGFWPSQESCDAALLAVEEARAGRGHRFQADTESETAGTQWWDVVVSPMLGVDGHPEQILAVAREITELKQDEARQTILMQEMAHRMKNMLAMVQAVATQTLRNAVSLDAAGEALGARLLALSHAHDVLMQGSWASACLRGMVDTAVALHGDGEPGRFVIEGEDVTLGPKPGMTLALILHELGTNATKYGALSNADGHVAISWRVETIEGSERLFFRWKEIGGPPVRTPTRIGFGTRLIERSLVHSFGGNARLEFPEDGVVLSMEAPFDAVVAGTKIGLKA